MTCKNIKSARKAANISQEELAMSLGVNRATISKYENGTITPTVEMLEKIAVVLGVFPYQLLDPPDAYLAASDRLNIDPNRLLVLMHSTNPAIKDLQDKIALFLKYPNDNNLKTYILHELSKKNVDGVLSMRIQSALDQLNADGQEKAVERVEELTEIPKYRRDIETPPEAPDGPPEAK